jgi:hypothetical protein
MEKERESPGSERLKNLKFSVTLWLKAIEDKETNQFPPTLPQEILREILDSFFLLTEVINFPKLNPKGPYQRDNYFDEPGEGLDELGNTRLSFRDFPKFVQYIPTLEDYCSVRKEELINILGQLESVTPIADAYLDKEFQLTDFEISKFWWKKRDQAEARLKENRYNEKVRRRLKRQAQAADRRVAALEKILDQQRNQIRSLEAQRSKLQSRLSPRKNNKRKTV